MRTFLEEHQIDNAHAEKLVQSLHKDHAKDLFPNTPVEVEAIGGRVHFAVEGEWDSWEETAAGSTKRLAEIITVHALYWAGDYPLLRPNWPGWDVIDKERLRQKTRKRVRRDPTLAD